MKIYQRMKNLSRENLALNNRSCNERYNLYIMCITTIKSNLV